MQCLYDGCSLLAKSPGYRQLLRLGHMGIGYRAFLCLRLWHPALKQLKDAGCPSLAWNYVKLLLIYMWSSLSQAAIDPISRMSRGGWVTRYM